MKIGPPAPHVRVEEVDGDLVLFDTERHQVYELNPTAGDIWRLATGEFDEQEMITLLARAYGVEPETIAADVTRVIADLRERGLLQPAAS